VVKMEMELRLHETTIK